MIASGESDIQVRSIAERIEERLAKDLDARPWHVEGLKQTRWVLLDYVDFVVHVFHREARVYYDLERLWADAPTESFGVKGLPAIPADPSPDRCPRGALTPLPTR